jgi:hypothetical protein
MKNRFVLLFLLVLILAGCGESQVGHSTDATTQATTAASGSVTEVNDSATLGSDISTFIARYGRPNDHSVPSYGLYYFKRYPDSNTDFLIITNDTGDGGVYTTRAEDVTVQAPKTDTGYGWTQEQAGVICGAFFPHDAVFQHRVERFDGYDTIYYSASVAKRFPTTAFTDFNNNQVQAGLFDVLSLYGVGTSIASCDILIGTAHI